MLEDSSNGSWSHESDDEDSCLHSDVEEIPNPKPQKPNPFDKALAKLRELQETIATWQIERRIEEPVEFNRPIQESINGEWRVTSTDGFDQLKIVRNLSEDQAFLLQFGHAFYQLNNDKFTSGTLVNGHQKDVCTATLNVPIERKTTIKVTFIEDDEIVTLCKNKENEAEEWRIVRCVEDGKLRVSHVYPSGIECLRVLERV